MRDSLGKTRTAVSTSSHTTTASWQLNCFIFRAQLNANRSHDVDVAYVLSALHTIHNIITITVNEVKFRALDYLNPPNFRTTATGVFFLVKDTRPWTSMYLKKKKF